MKRNGGVLFVICSLAALLAGGCNRSERAREYHPPSGAERAGGAEIATAAAKDAR